ncbi:MAG: hypothetical protein IGQ45_01655 [Cyanobacterium sp. T60_A2020_053]|nr:hypothetical protein [Cyanobacterium sp. T60_A2020_053]
MSINNSLVLVSKLVLFEQGKYVVKVTAKQNQQILGTAMGAGDTVEGAEDKARERVLKFINASSITLHQASSATITTNPAPITPTIQPVKKVESKSVNLPLTKVENTTNFPLENYLKKENQSIEEENNYVPEIIENKEEEITISPEEDQINLELPLNLEKSAPDNYQNPSFDLNETVDFTQVIDQTTIELKRLGWTQEQGKKYLLETYGKKSRHLLDDNELIEFLNYLQSI